MSEILKYIKNAIVETFTNPINWFVSVGLISIIIWSNIYTLEKFGVLQKEVHSYGFNILILSMTLFLFATILKDLRQNREIDKAQKMIDSILEDVKDNYTIIKKQTGGSEE